MFYMSTPTGAVEPRQTGAIQGTVITPSGYVDGHSVATHSFLNTLRQVVMASTAFKHEGDQLAALNSVDAFEKATIKPADQKHVIQETDIAPVEDVSLRRNPNAPLPMPATGPAIDYALLAQAIVAAQQAQASQSELTDPEVHVITDVPETPASPVVTQQ
jgi:hypothetical protein